jgi:hypothetical protein
MTYLDFGTVIIKRPRIAIERKQAWEMEACCLTDFGLNIENPSCRSFRFWNSLLLHLLFKKYEHDVFVNKIQGKSAGSQYTERLNKAGIVLPSGKWFPARILSEIAVFQTVDRIEV